MTLVLFSCVAFEIKESCKWLICLLFHFSLFSHRRFFFFFNLLVFIFAFLGFFFVCFLLLVFGGMRSHYGVYVAPELVGSVEASGMTTEVQTTVPGFFLY